MKMIDQTEDYRRARQAELNLNSEAGARAELEAHYGQVWNTDDLRKEFKVTGFMAPYVVVERISDGKVGSLEFQHSPRFYFNWCED